MTGGWITQADRSRWQRRAAAELAAILDAHPDLPVIAWTVTASGGALSGQVLAPAAGRRGLFGRMAAGAGAGRGHRDPVRGTGRLFTCTPAVSAAASRSASPRPSSTARRTAGERPGGCRWRAAPGSCRPAGKADGRGAPGVPGRRAGRSIPLTRCSAAMPAASRSAAGQPGRSACAMATTSGGFMPGVPIPARSPCRRMRPGRGSGMRRWPAARCPAAGSGQPAGGCAPGTCAHGSGPGNPDGDEWLAAAAAGRPRCRAGSLPDQLLPAVGAPGGCLVLLPPPAAGKSSAARTWRNSPRGYDQSA